MKHGHDTAEGLIAEARTVFECNCDHARQVELTRGVLAERFIGHTHLCQSLTPQGRYGNALISLLTSRAAVAPAEALIGTAAALLRSAPVPKGHPWIMRAVEWLRRDGVPGTTSPVDGLRAAVAQQERSSTQAEIDAAPFRSSTNGTAGDFQMPVLFASSPEAAPPPADEGLTWQPIETAPKDGMSLLLFDGRTVSYGGWMSAADQGCEPSEEHLVSPGWWSVDLSENRPTHWMPLPQPPVLMGDRS